MTTVYYSTPYKAGDIGGGINDFVALLPDDAWVCIRDADTLFLTSEQQPLIQLIAASDPPFDVIGCKTNRLRSAIQCHEGQISDDPDISHHIAIAHDLFAQHGGLLMPVPPPHVAGMFMLFRKSLWDEFKIPERTAYFDVEWTRQLHANGKRLGLAVGLYLWHSYRFGKKDPANYTKHLRGAGL